MSQPGDIDPIATSSAANVTDKGLRALAHVEADGMTDGSRLSQSAKRNV